MITITTEYRVPTVDPYTGGPAHVSIGGQLYRVVSVSESGTQAEIEPVPPPAAPQPAMRFTSSWPWYRRHAR